MSGNAKHVRAARFVRDPRVANLSDEQCAEFIQEKLGYTREKSIKFVKECRNNPKIAQMMERAGPRGRGPVSMVNYGYPLEKTYSCGDGRQTTLPNVKTGPCGVSMRPCQAANVNRAKDAIRASYGTPEMTVNCGDGCCPKVIPAVDPVPLPTCADYPIKCQDCPEAAPPKKCMRDMLQCCPSICAPTTTTPVPVYEDVSNCNCTDFEYPWVLLCFADKNMRKKQQCRTGLFRWVSCGVNHYKEALDLVCCGFYDRVMDSPFGAKLPAFCDQLLIGTTADGMKGKANAERFQERAIPAFAKWCFGAEPVAEKRQAADAEEAPAAVPVDAKETDPGYAVVATAQDFAYLLESFAANLEEWVDYRIAAGLLADDTYHEIKSLARAGGYRGHINKDIVKSWKTSTNDCLKRAYEYYICRSCDRCKSARRDLMIARAKLDNWTGYEFACYPDQQDCNGELACLQQDVDDAAEVLECCIENQRWDAYPNEMRLAYKAWKTASILGTHADCICFPTFVFILADEYTFDCCQCCVLRDGLTEFFKKVIRFARDADITSGEDGEEETQVTVNLEAMAPCRHAEGRAAAQWRHCILRDSLAALLALKNEDKEVGAIIGDLENPANPRSLNLIVSPGTQKICYGSYNKLATCFPHFVCEGTLEPEKCVRYIHIVPETCDNIVGRGGECIMLPECQISATNCTGCIETCAAMDAAVGTPAAPAACNNPCGCFPPVSYQDGCWRPCCPAGTAGRKCLKSCAQDVHEDLVADQAVIDLIFDTFEGYLRCWCENRTRCLGSCDRIRTFNRPDPVMIGPNQPTVDRDANITVNDHAAKTLLPAGFDVYDLNFGRGTGNACSLPYFKESCVSERASENGDPKSYPSVDRAFCMSEEDIVHTAAKLITDWARSFKPWSVNTIVWRTHCCQGSHCGDNAPKPRARAASNCSEDDASAIWHPQSMSVCGLDYPCSMFDLAGMVETYLVNIKVVHPLMGKYNELRYNRFPFTGAAWGPDGTSSSDNGDNLTEYFLAQTGADQKIVSVSSASTPGVMCFNYVRISDLITGCCPETYVRDMFRPLTDSYAPGDVDYDIVIKHLQGDGKCAATRNFFHSRKSLVGSTEHGACTRTQPAWDGHCYKMECEDCRPSKCCSIPKPCLKEQPCGCTNLCSPCDQYSHYDNLNRVHYDSKRQ